MNVRDKRHIFSAALVLVMMVCTALVISTSCGQPKDYYYWKFTGNLTGWHQDIRTVVVDEHTQPEYGEDLHIGRFVMEYGAKLYFEKPDGSIAVHARDSFLTRSRAEGLQIGRCYHVEARKLKASNSYELWYVYQMQDCDELQ